MVRGAITNSKINRKYYIIIYGKKYLNNHVIFKWLYNSSYMYLLFPEDMIYDHSIQRNFLLCTMYYSLS